jgi:hypothetical protein
VRTPQETVETYIRAKDQNQPHLMQNAFAADAILEMVVNAGTISFPSVCNGLQSISDVLVRRFAQTFENVHTFCLASPPRNDAVNFSCAWLVGMSEKDGGAVRVGCGRYDWLFHRQSPHLVEHLTITIDLMESIAPSCLEPLMSWLSQLSYPWCTAQAALREALTLEELQPIRKYLTELLPLRGPTTFGPERS